MRPLGKARRSSYYLLEQGERIGLGGLHPHRGDHRAGFTHDGVMATTRASRARHSIADPACRALGKDLARRHGREFYHRLAQRGART